MGDAEQSVIYADRSGDAGWRMISRATHADALHQAGKRTEAGALFGKAERMQKEMQREYPLLYSLRGFTYCDLLLGEAERAAWQTTLAYPHPSPLPGGEGVIAACRAVAQRAAQTLKWATDAELSLHTLALGHLTLGRAALYEAILTNSEFRIANSESEQAVAGLRRAGQQFLLVQGLLTRAWLRFVTGDRSGDESAQTDLDEAWEIAERGPMRLFMADIHLHRARLFFREATYPWESAEADLAAARKLIEECGYGRRREELEDAERALRAGNAGENPAPLRG